MPWFTIDDHHITEDRYMIIFISEVAQSCLTLCNSMDCSLPGSSVHGIFQARILEWVAISLSRRSSQPRDWTLVSHIVGRRFTMPLKHTHFLFKRPEKDFFLGVFFFWQADTISSRHFYWLSEDIETTASFRQFCGFRQALQHDGGGWRAKEKWVGVSLSRS